MNQLRLIFPITFLSLIPLQSFATDQVGDILIFNNDTFRLHHTPFSIYETQLDKLMNLEVSASNCWRGYQGEWVIKDSVFYLSNLYHCGSRSKTYNWNSLVEKILGRKFENGLIKADWVSGDFWAGNGYVRAESHYPAWENEVHFYVTKGKVDSTKTFSAIYHPESNPANINRLCYPAVGKTKLQKMMEEDDYLFGTVILNLDPTGKVNSFDLKEEEYMRPYQKTLITKMARRIKYYSVFHTRGNPLIRVEVPINITARDVEIYLEETNQSN